MSLAKINITFILPSLVAGGAERVMSLVAQNIDKTRFNATLLVIGFEKDKAYSIEDIKVVYLNKTRVLHGIPKLFAYIFKHKLCIVVGCMTHVNIPVALILLVFPKLKDVEGNEVADAQFLMNSKPKLRINRIQSHNILLLVAYMKKKVMSEF